ncbi:MAG TPA: nucleotidyltransferase family protein [Perlabentimonas sp.]|nr:nucleotidyltransferase family protein [Bacteroidales bacterium]MDD4671753.1 nucleotidyltransferase family protein [Bacteroidales bacterium]MDY0347499.1 nucleotidyltransferase family protein [Tenuifilaceae bacterium]HZJ74801.1 nucleotidyltransferase family protein [Perlabentimonas sp.]
MKAFVLAAGLGTRLGALTSKRPKALVELNGKPLLEHILVRLASFGFTDIVVNVHHYAEQIVSFINSHSFGASIKISDESDKLLDTGGAILKAKPFLKGNEPFLVHNVDIVSDIDLAQLMERHLRSNPLATLAVGDRYSSRKLLFDSSMNLWGWKNIVTGETKMPRKSDCELIEMAFSGIHVVSPSFYSKVMSSDAFPIISEYLELSKTEPIIGFNTSDNFIIDSGKIENLPMAEDFLKAYLE